MVFISVAAWGFAFGGTPALFQMASAHASGEAADVAQSIIVTVWNIAIAGGGIVGGVLLDALGVRAFAWTLVGLLLIATVIELAYRGGFPIATGNRWQARQHHLGRVPQTRYARYVD